MATLLEHAAHGQWREVQPCVYCACGERLYQGSLPDDILAFAEQMDNAIAKAVEKVEGQ